VEGGLQVSNTVDERVVKMQFDNAQFEKNVQTSLGTLGKLKEALKFDKVDLSSVASNIEKITEKVSGMGGVFDTAMDRIANKIVDIGEKIATEFVFNPPTDGFKEYELKMDSLKVIMESSHESLETVNKYLNELNKYSDQTIYSFSDMTASIGKFTNAGVDLNTAVNAIKGIANEAALAGASTNDASRAMYNFAQALSAGSVKLIDWKSIENANMATQEFKNELINTAVELGTLTKVGDDYISTTTNMQGKISETFNATKGFNDSLAYQWMTTDVLTKTLGRYADANTDVGARATKAATEVRTFSAMMDSLKEAVGSGWAETWELIFGNMEEATEMWTAVNDVLSGFIDKFSSARNDLLKGWREGDIDGRTKLLEGLANVFKILGNVVKPFSDAMKVLFPPMTAERLKDITIKFADFTEKVKNITENFPMKLFEPKDTNAVQKGLGTAAEKAEKFNKNTKAIAKDIKDAWDGTAESSDDATKTAVDNLEEIQDAVKKTINGDFGNDQERVDALQKAGFDPDQIQDYVNKVRELSNGSWDLSDEMMNAAAESLGLIQKTSDATDETKEKVDEAKDSLEEYNVEVSEITKNGNILTSILVSIGSIIKNVLGSGVKIIGAVGEAWRESFSPVTISLAQLKKFGMALDNVSKSFKISDGALEKIKNTFKDFFTVLKTVSDLVVRFVIQNAPLALAILKDVGRIIGGVVLGIASFVASVASAIAKSGILQKILDGVNMAFRALRKIIATVADVFGFLGEKISKGIDYIRDYVKQHELLAKIANAIPNLFNKAGNKITEFGNKLAKSLGVESLEKFKAKLGEAIDRLSQNFLIPGFERFATFIEELVTGNMSMDKVTKFFSDLGKDIRDFAKSIFTNKDGTPSIFDHISNFFKGADLTGKLKNFGGILKDIGAAIKSFFSGLVGKDFSFENILPDKIFNLFGSFADKGEKAKNKLKDVGDGIADTVTNLNPFKKKGAAKDVVDTVKNVEELENLSEVMKPSITDRIKNFFNGFKNLATDSFKKFSDFLSKLDFVKVLTAARSIKVITSIFNGIKLTKSFSGMADNIGGFFEKLKDDGLGINLVPEESKFTKMVKIAGAIYLVAKAISMIAEIPKDRFKSAVAVVAGIAAVLTGVTIALEKIKPAEGADLGGASKLMLGMAIAIFIIAKAMEIIGQQDANTLIAGGIVIAVLVDILTEAAKSLKELKLSTADVAAPLAFALAVRILIGAVVAFGKMDRGTLLQGGVCVFIALGILQGSAQALKDLKLGPADVAAPLAFAIAVGLLLLSILAYALVPVPVLKKGFVAVLIALALLAAASNSLRAMKVSAAAVFAPLAFALALLILVGAIAALGLIPDDVFPTAFDRMTSLAILLGGFMLVQSLIAKYIGGQVGAADVLSLIAFAVAIDLLAVACLVLSVVPPDRLASAVNAILWLGFVVGALAAIMAISSSISNVNPSNIFGLITAVGAILLLSIATAALAMIPKPLLEKGRQSIEALALVVIALMFALSVSSDISAVNPSNIIGLVVAVGSILLLGIATIALSMIPKPLLEKGKQAVEALALVIVAIMFAMSMSSDISSIGASNIAALLVAVGSIYLLAIAAIALGLVPRPVLEQGVGTIVILGIILGAIVGVMGAFNFNVASVLAPLAVVLAVMVLVEAVKQLGAMESTDMAQGVFGVVALLMGLAVAIGVLATFAGPILVLAASFVVFATGALLLGAAFLMAATGVMNIVTALSLLAVIPTQQLAMNMIVFSTALLVLIGVFAGLVAILMFIPAAIPVLLALGAGVLMLGTGLYLASAAIEKFVNVAGQIGGAIASAVSSVVKHAPEIGHAIKNALSSAAKYIASHVGEFASKAKELAIGIAKGIKEKAPEILAKVKEGITKAGEFITSHAPEWLAKGAELLGKLVEGIATNAPKVLEKVEEGITNAVNFVKEKAPEWLSAGKDLVQGLIDGAGEKIGEVGTKAKEIGKKALDAIKNFLGIKSPSTKFKEVGNNAGQGLIDGVDEKGGEVESSSQGLGGKLLNGITDALSSLGDKVSSIFGDTKDTVESEGSEIAEAGANSMAQFADGVDSGMTTVGPVVEKGLGQMLEAINSMNSKWQGEGKKLGESLATGVSKAGTRINRSGKDVSKKGAEGAKSTKNKWIDVGKALADGLAKGVKDHSSKIESAAKSAAERAYKAAKNKLGVKSPSRVFARLGKFVDLGLAKGISDNSGAINSSAKAMAEKLITTAERALAPVAELMNSNMIDDPVIKPVLDLSDFQNGSNRLYSMMSDMDRYSLHGNVDLATNTAFSVDRERQSRRDRDDDVLSALIDGLKELKRQNDEPHGNTYIIDGITYDDGSNVANAIGALIRAAKVGGRA
jgi:hypothetical protein